MRVTDLPPLVLTQSAFYGLYEYSWTTPTNPALGRTWRRRVDDVPHWLIGRHDAVPFNGHPTSIGWYCPCVIPDRATLEECDGLWVGRLGRFTMAASRWLWVWRELWREAGEPASIEPETLRRAA